MKRFTVSIFFVVALALVSVGQTFAAPMGYIDPATGGMIAQILLVILAALSSVFYFFKNRIVMYYKKLTRQPIEEPAMAEQASDSIADQEKQE